MPCQQPPRLHPPRVPASHGIQFHSTLHRPLGTPIPSLWERLLQVFSPISLCGLWIRRPCHYLRGSDIPPLIDWTRRAIPVSDPPLITETIILRIHRLTFPVISGRSLSTLLEISSYINSDVSGLAGAALWHSWERLRFSPCPAPRTLFVSADLYLWSPAVCSQVKTLGS